VLRGICIDKGDAAGLVEETKYYLFPNGESHFYVSKFPNSEAHQGCFRADLFKIINDNEDPEEPEEKQITLDPTKIYRAKLIWRSPGYRSNNELKEYFIRPLKKHGYYYKDPNLKQFKGCFPLHWFEKFEEVDIQSIDTVEREKKEMDQKEKEIMQLQQEIENFLGEDVQRTDEDYLDYLREVAAVIKYYGGPQKGIVGPYEFTYSGAGQFKVTRDGNEIDIFRFRQMKLEEFL